MQIAQTQRPRFRQMSHFTSLAHMLHSRPSSAALWKRIHRRPSLEMILPSALASEAQALAFRFTSMDTASQR